MVEAIIRAVWIDSEKDIKGVPIATDALHLVGQKLFTKEAAQGSDYCTDCRIIIVIGRYVY